MRLKIAGIRFHQAGNGTHFWLNQENWDANLKPVQEALQDAGIRFRDMHMRDIRLPLTFLSEDDMNMALMIFGED